MRSSAAKKSTSPKTLANVSISGIVDRLYKSTDTWSAGKLKRTDEAVNGCLEKDKLVSFTAPIALKEHDSIVLHGAWGYHNKYGSQFVAKDVGYNLQMDSDGLALWLQKNVNIKGIGPAKAKIIADTFGERFDEVITNRPDDVMRAAKLTVDDTNNLRDIWIKQKNHKNLVTMLAGLGLSIHEIGLLIAKYGERSGIILQSNPYLIIGEIKRFAFKKVDAMARKAGIPKDHPERIRQGILWCVDDDLDRGNTWISRDDLVNKANRLLELDSIESTKIIGDAVQALVLTNRLESRDVNGTPGIVEPDISKIEAFIAVKLRFTKEVVDEEDHTIPVNPVWGPSTMWFCGDVRDKFPTLNEQQLNAVLCALNYPISVITGSAGSGKTYTVKSIAQIYKQQDKDVTLCAPTGKAARRLTESTGYDASTIHRLLGYDGKTFEYGESINGIVKRLDTDLIVIDETSMVDSRLAYHLFKAIDFNRTAIVLVGDHHQLPPVGPGNLLRDLVESNVVPTTVLREVVRQAGVLKANCSEILNGKVMPTCAPDPVDGQVPWQVINDFTDPTSCRLFLESIVEQLLVEYPSLDMIKHFQILIPQHKGELGVEAVNIACQRIYQKVRRGFTVEPVQPGKRPKLYAGDKVIQTRNNYSLDLMNGSIGSILKIEKDGTLECAFDGIDRDVIIPPDERGHLQLAYALTIHKSQGSEFPFVILVVHKNQSFMHDQHLVYTGVTRSKKKLIILGDKWGISNSAKKQQGSGRVTLLSELLKG
jgi:exodeoxyribonuclease V alpha subunit